MSCQITINGRRVDAEIGETVLAAAQRAGIHIPTLCHHEAVEPFGACRLCMVEVTKASWKGWKGLMTACLYPVAPDLIIETDSERVTHVRRNVLDLLLARCPGSELIQRLAAEYGVTQTTFTPRENPDNCILCGLCVRVCEATATSAISTVHRGHQREIGTPWGGPPPDCIGCGACAESCPTGHISMTEQDGVRSIWQRDFEMVRCAECGQPFMTVAHRDHLVAQQSLDASYFNHCSACKREKTATKMAEIVRRAHPDFVPPQLGGVPTLPVLPPTVRRTLP